jgi:hypothetical protein
MSERTTRTDIPPEDIDLLALTERSIIFFRKYYKVFIISIVVGLGLGFLTWLRLPTVYKSRLVIHSYTLSNLDYIQVVSNWNRLLKGGEKDLLASSLGIPRQSISKVKEIKGVEIQKIFTPNNPNGFYIDVFVTDNAVLDELQKGMLTGFENVDFIKKQLVIKKENLNTLIAQVMAEIKKLDSTRDKVTSMLGNGNGHSSSLIVDITGLNRQRIDLNEKLLYLQQDLKLASAVQVIQGFSKFNKPAGPNKIVWLGLGLISGLAFAFVFTVIHSIKVKLKARALETNKQ